MRGVAPSSTLSAHFCECARASVDCFIACWAIEAISSIVVALLSTTAAAVLPPRGLSAALGVVALGVIGILLSSPLPFPLLPVAALGGIAVVLSSPLPPPGRPRLRLPFSSSTSVASSELRNWRIAGDGAA